jgi:hypothetical protein
MLVKLQNAAENPEQFGMQYLAVSRRGSEEVCE